MRAYGPETTLKGTCARRVGWAAPWVGTPAARDPCKEVEEHGGAGLSFRPDWRRVVPGFCFRRFTVHYPHRISRLKRKRSIGFRARMRTHNGRKMMNRKRRVGRSLNVADK